MAFVKPDIDQVAVSKRIRKKYAAKYPGFTPSIYFLETDNGIRQIE